MIKIYNSHAEDFTSEPNNFYCGRSRHGNPLGNPFTFNGVRTNIAKLSCKTREDSIKAYEIYFDKMYGKDEELTQAFDEIYQHYKNGEDIYLQCFCKPLPCHGDFLAEELQRRLVLDNMKARNNIV
jgi:hypothetical protein